jgi:hypothetical protein
VVQAKKNKKNASIACSSALDCGQAFSSAIALASADQPLKKLLMEVFDLE